MGSQYSTFDLAFRESEGRLAIWYKSPRGMDYLVHPRSFFNAIVGDKGVTYFFVRDKKNLWSGLNNIRSYLIFDHNECLILVDDCIYGKTEAQKIPINVFLAKTKASYIELFKAFKSGDGTYYENDVKEEELSLIVQQLDTVKAFTSTDNPYREAVKVEHFSFKANTSILIYDSEYEIPIDISIGNRTYKASYNGNDDLDMIRHQLEVMSYEFELGFRLEWDYGADGVDIRLKKFQAGYATRNADGSFSAVYLCKVALFSCDDRPAIIGICDPRQVIKEIYEAMLNMGRNNKNGWYCNHMALYNKMKSKIIENYINKVKVPYKEVAMRQQVVKHVFTICPDYGGVLFDDEEKNCYGCESLEDDEELNLHIDKSLVSELRKWQSEFESKTDGVNSTMGTLDSKEWNRRGMELAQRLRQQLPDNYDLWYAYPFEDEENLGKRPMLIYKDHAAINAEAFSKMALLSNAIKKVSCNDNEKKDDE